MMPSISVLSKSFIVYLAGKSGSIFVGLAAAPIVLGVIGISGFSILLAFFALQGVIKCMDFGISGVAGRVASDIICNEGDANPVRRQLQLLERVLASLGVAIALSVVVLWDVAAPNLLASNQDEIWVFKLALFVWLLSSWTHSFYINGLIGLGRSSYTAVLQFSIDLARWMSGCASLAYFGSGDLAAILLSCAAPNFIVALFLYFLFWRKVGRPAGRTNGVALNKRRLGAALTGFSAAIAFGQLALNGDRMLIAHLSGRDALVSYGVAMTYASALPLAGGLLNDWFYRHLAGAYATGKQKFVSSTGQYLLITLIIVAPLFFVMFFFSDQVMSLWLGGHFFPEMSALARIVLFANFFGCLSAALDNLQVASFNLKWIARSRLVWLIIFMPVSWLMIGNFGPFGMAWTWVAINSSLFFVSALRYRAMCL